MNKNTRWICTLPDGTALVTMESYRLPRGASDEMRRMLKLRKLPPGTKFQRIYCANLRSRYDS